jgi:hypothetical protein
MPSFEPYFDNALDKRRYVVLALPLSPKLGLAPLTKHALSCLLTMNYRLLNLYNKLHSNIHNKPNTLKVHHETNTTSIALAWSTPLFELYAVAPAHTSRAALAQSANKIIQWVRREEERVFIIGGAVF